MSQTQNQQFAGEQVRSSCRYPKEYRGPRSIEDQIQVLAQIFGLDPSQALEFVTGLPKLPEAAEGWFAIPRWKKLAPTYREAVEKVLTMIESKRKFCNLQKGLLGVGYLRQHTQKVKGFKKLGDEQKGHDILVVPAQFGFRHRGRSIRRAREVMNAFEFGLGAFEVGIMLLTHPERLQHPYDLMIDSGGDEFASSHAFQFTAALRFLCAFGDAELRFGSNTLHAADGACGSASGFLPA